MALLVGWLVGGGKVQEHVLGGSELELVVFCLASPGLHGVALGGPGFWSGAPVVRMESGHHVLRPFGFLSACQRSRAEVSSENIWLGFQNKRSSARDNHISYCRSWIAQTWNMLTP